MRAFELVVAGAFGLLAVRSLLHWLRSDFVATSMREQVLFVLHVTARVGMWVALSVVFVAYSVAEEPQSLDWFLLVLVALPGLQLFSGFLLSMSGREGRPARDDYVDSPQGMVGPMDVHGRPGPLEPEKSGETSEPPLPQPQAAEVESARLLANKAGEALEAEGLSDEDVRRLADEYIALDLGEDLDGFILWARRRARR